ncbi:Abi family protein [Rothia sp. SD9660Na]|uniref:Abi family protein n=1 Tax=Rothia sp. SD9660Na TaxID=3047030 RepID=UPI0024B8B553|nr:Abi family protein [Rothia sp. SD9660Na]WHS49634.1 Abi family protein [Rothia sp. SD9660Na]
MAEKGFLDHPDLINRLEQLGMQIDDKTKAETELRRLGYHRTSGYRYPFRKLREPLTDELMRRREFRHDEFEAGSRFEDSIALADFDTKLRAVILTGIFDLEVRLRTAIAHVIAKKNPKGHLEISCLDSTKCYELTSSRDEITKFEAWKAQYESAKKSKNNDDFIAHHTLVYKTEIPVWAALEIVSFGTLIHFYLLMKVEDQNDVARKFGVRQGTKFGSWLLAIMDLRNDCAHGARVFNKSMKRNVSVHSNSYFKKYLKHIDKELPADKIYMPCVLLAHMLRCHESGTNWHNTFKTQVKKLPQIYLKELSEPLITAERNMGFPSNWQELEIWNN